MAFQALPGFRDFYPEEMSLRRHVEGAWHAAARAAGFLEIDGPPLESLDLFKAKSGNAIVEQLYTFKDKGDRWVALRAELTPSLARMVGARAASLRKPIKWYSVPQLFRYERQQRGRLREHVQWNVDVVGASEIAADAEVLAVALDGLQRLGLTDKHLCVRISHRSLVENKIRGLGFDDDSVEVLLRLIDKGMLQVEAALLLAGKQKELEELIRWLQKPAEPAGELADFLAACGDYGLAGYVEVDKNIVRGLAYYTGIVWEIHDRERTLRAVAGGGRYDTLIEKLGGPSLPALGFGMGDVVLSELLTDHRLRPAQEPRLDAVVVPIGEEMLGPARQVVRRLRELGLSAEAPYAAGKVGKALKAADAAGARRAYLVGPEEWAERKVKVKDLASGEESTASLEALA
ncbi:MAG: histidine--tRNA ligase [Planctomycetota bacterium]|jgi:histidyl-tRNA synthetase